MAAAKKTDAGPARYDQRQLPGGFSAGGNMAAVKKTDAGPAIIKRPPYIKSAKAGNTADIKKTGAVPLSLFSMKSLLSFDTILRCQHLPLSDSKICSRAY